MDANDLAHIAKECCSYPVKVNDYHWCGEGEFIFNAKGLESFAQRIEQPLQQRIAELEQDNARLKTLVGKVTDEAHWNAVAKDKQIEQFNHGWALVEEHEVHGKMVVTEYKIIGEYAYTRSSFNGV